VTDCIAFLRCFGYSVFQHTMEFSSQQPESERQKAERQKSQPAHSASADSGPASRGYSERPNFDAPKPAPVPKPNLLKPLAIAAAAIVLAAGSWFALDHHAPQVAPAPAAQVEAAHQGLSLGPAQLDTQTTDAAIAAIRNGTSIPAIASLSDQQKMEILTGERQFYSLPVAGTPKDAAATAANPGPTGSDGRVRVDFNGALYADYDLSTDLSNISIPVKLGDTIGVTCLATGQDHRPVVFRIVDTVGPIQSTPMNPGDHQEWKVMQVKADYSKELPWLQTEAANGNSVAEDGLGYVYQNGMGVAQDMSQALHWYQKAAAQGNADAQSRLQSLGH